MECITNSRKTLGSLYAILIILACMATVSFGSLSAEIDTDRENYCHIEEINFDATIKLTECEQVDSMQLQIGDSSCNLPKSYGYYPLYGNCNLDVTVTETNPDNCYTYGGSNTINYQITWSIPENFGTGIYEAGIIVNTAVGSTSGSVAFSNICETTTTTQSTTTTTQPETSTTTLFNSTTTTSCPGCCTTTTLHKTYGKREGNTGGYPSKPPKVVAACSDNVKNYGETDVDCGGLCPPCEEGKRCIKNSDCVGKNCFNGVCTQVSCSDEIQNQDETDVDCGGSCDRCDEGLMCAKDSDCTTDYCQDGTCAKKPETEEGCDVKPTCTDQIRNQDETDVDCGGPCKQCADTKRCKLDSDCANNYCFQGICRTPTCSDGIKNQGEKGIDCGGSCKACAPGGVIGYITSISGDLGNILLILIILLLLAALFLYLSRKRKYVASADFLNTIESDDDLDTFINKKRPCVVAGTSRKIRRLKKYIDEGKIDIIWIKDWDYVNDLINKGLDDNNAESIALAKQVKAGIFIQNPEAKKIAEEAGLKAYDKL
jgi:LPXTG-motif cell wall-anchored protein